eukprot:TRINITY_DN1223_c0_g1_i1.p1 TRINITY_DN1223_c0_g1~~TRINITY_DN1223_c0_g1_i1.p1  ORF type:complete len:223 (+),score=49.51 TRINITY_DN1223_c0_g1_i1:50-670(+)
MEVQVLEAEGLPPDAVITFKVGADRKQSIMEVGQSCKVPTVSASSCTVNILRNAGTAELPVPKADGDSKDSADTVTVQVQKADGQATEVILRSAAAKSANHVGVNGWKAGEQARDTVQALMAEILRERPADPYAFMVSRLRSFQDQQSRENGNRHRTDCRSTVDLVVMRASRISLEGPADGRTSVTKFVRDEVMGHFDDAVPNANA